MRTLATARLMGLFAAGALVVAGCGSSPAKNSRGAQAGRADCQARALRAVRGPSVSAQTDQLVVVVVLLNETSVACSLRASPRIALYGQRGSELPFGYRNSPAPERGRLKIAAHGRVFVALTKQPCTLHASGLAMSLDLRLARNQTLHLRLGSSGALDYCGAQDPTGHTVHVLPLARTLKSLLAGA